MFANSQMMGISVGFPDVLLKPTPLPQPPVPYPSITGSPMGPSIGPSGDFVKWGSTVRSQSAVLAEARNELNQAIATILDVKSKVIAAMDEVDSILGRIEELQSQQRKFMMAAAKMENEVARAFKSFAKSGKSTKPKASESAKAILISKGIALNAQLLALQGLNKAITKQQKALESAAKKLK